MEAESYGHSKAHQESGVMRGYAMLCGAMWCHAGLCGAMRGYAGLCGAMRGYAGLCGVGAMMCIVNAAMRGYAVLCGPVKIHAPLLPAMIFNVIVVNTIGCGVGQVRMIYVETS